jgi:hypothetical protein
MSAEPRKHARKDQSDTIAQPEDQILDLFGSRWLRNSFCVGSQLAAEVRGDEAEWDSFESTLSGQANLTAGAETVPSCRSIESERGLSLQGDDPTISLGERQEIVRQLLLATREAEDGQQQHPNRTTDPYQFRFSDFC